MMLVLFSNLLWIVVCGVYCILCISQARADRAKGAGFQRPLSKEELERSASAERLKRVPGRA